MAPPPSATMADGPEDDEAAKLRALDTLSALSALLGPSMPMANPPDAATKQYDSQSVSAWCAVVGKPTKDTLAEPTVCPPYSDPSSVLIVDQESLDYELESTCSTVTDGEASSRIVRFRNSVAVVEIPSHRDLDPDVAKAVWSSTDEVQANGRRSTMEWDYDGRDWQNVLEEHDMIYDPVTDDYIHPATWEEMEYDRMHQEHMQQLLVAQMQELERQERIQKEQKLQEVSAKERRRRRKKKGQRSPPRNSPRYKARKRSPKVAPAPMAMASLTRFADT